MPRRSDEVRPDRVGRVEEDGALPADVLRLVRGVPGVAHAPGAVQGGAVVAALDLRTRPNSDALLVVHRETPLLSSDAGNLINELKTL